MCSVLTGLQGPPILTCLTCLTWRKHTLTVRHGLPVGTGGTGRSHPPQGVGAAASGPLAVGDIARRMPVSRPAVSQHLKVLKEAGLVADRPEGARRVYYIDPKGLGGLRAWLDRLRDEALIAFQAEVEHQVRQRKDEKA